MTSKATCIWFIIASLLRASFGANEIGCWNDGEDRAMQGAFFEDWWTMTLDSCQQFCYDNGFRYAGAENGHECYCDDWYWKHGGADHCITPCSGDWGIMCGGGWALTVMDTGYSPCNNNPCVNGGNCVANGRSYSCSCPAPWAGTNCEIYVNPCNNRPCANGGACTPAGAGFSCSCVAPYSGSTCQTYNDPCANRPCANGGVCRASGATYSCSCVAPYSGTTCQTYNDPCANKPCANGGACKASGASYTCTCVAPYSGTTCQTYNDPCANKPCANGGVCTASGATFTCTCVAPYTGTTCQTYVDPCANKPCANGGVCTASGATFTCTCVAPYTGTTCETYVDPCENGPCSNGGSCKSSGASYTCSCTALFNGTNCETMRVACLDDIQVSYYNDSKEVPPPPPNTIRDVNGGSSDINKNMRGAYVWLVPVWKSSSSQVVTDIQLRIESSSVAGYSNLVEGAAGGFRYLQLTRSDATSTCINNVALWRTSSSTNLPSQQGWQHCTSNINEGRGGDYLFLCWAFV